ncbi:Uncharacterized protein FWK35_00026745 [Aphis craccivora]|uniref:Uncharacterized protein n=1 Tax=Aphis craccivora TaxID=307492 RepID=A0A6G0VW12_APHCR|nr:Uncharacterized protein FWK35_00026745 [Aphis craccivora]
MIIECRTLLLVVLDKMKLSESVTIPTPEHQTNKKGDHALVPMTLCFNHFVVNESNLFNTVLHKIIIEAILLLKKSGFNVDVVTTDGATWNRNYVVCGQNLVFLKKI